MHRVKSSRNGQCSERGAVPFPWVAGLPSSDEFRIGTGRRHVHYIGKTGNGTAPGSLHRDNGERDGATFPTATLRPPLWQAHSHQLRGNVPSTNRHHNVLLALKGIGHQ